MSNTIHSNFNGENGSARRRYLSVGDTLNNFTVYELQKSALTLTFLEYLTLAMTRISRQRLPSRQNWHLRQPLQNSWIVTLLLYIAAFGVGLMLHQLIIAINEANAKNKPKTSTQIRQNLINKYKRPRVGGNSFTENQIEVQIHQHDERPDADLPANTKSRSIENSIKELYGTTQVKACQWYRRNDKGALRVVEDLDCMDDDATLIVYNSIDHDRILCGHVVAGNQFLLLPEKCKEPSRLFTKDPTLDGTDIPPLVIRGEQSNPALLPTNVPSCNIPCQVVGETSVSGDIKRIDGTRWKFIHSMESSGYYNVLKIDSLAHTKDKYYSTVSFNSEIPLPYFSYAEYQIQQPSIDFDNAIKGASFIARNCGSNNNRESVVTNLTSIMRVDSLSRCLQNANPPHNMTMKNKAAVQRQFLFHLAFENTCEDDYITEKLWGTLESGTLPVYYGAPNVKDHVPPNSIISWHDFNNTQKLGEYLLKVAGNKTLYDSYHSWRTLPLPQSFLNKYDFTHTHSSCRMCRWAHAKKYGFGWNHTTQSIQELSSSRKICVDSNGLVTSPVRERWFKGPKLLQAAETDDRCGNNIPTFKQVESFKRTLWSHDGILDFVIEGTGEDGTIQLQLPIEATVVRKSSQHYEAQNDVARVTVLSHWQSEPTKNNDGSLSISVAHKGEMWIRVVVEDLDTFHVGGLNESTHFGKLAAKDFFEPLQFFWILDPTQTSDQQETPFYRFDDDLESAFIP